ncbi:MAG: nitroreductase family protein [Acidimicrobiales bacterium]
MDLKSAALQRRMVRCFSEEAVDPAAIDRILDLANRAPSAGNTDGRAFLLLVGREQTQVYWDATTTAEWRAKGRRYRGMANAPIVVVVLADPSRYTDRYDEPDKRTSGLGTGAGGEGSWPIPYWYFDAGAAVMAMLLAVTDEGLGACFIGNFRGEDELLRNCSVVGSWRFVGAVLIGHPEGEDPPSASVLRGRPPLSQVVHRGRWNIG